MLSFNRLFPSPSSVKLSLQTRLSTQKEKEVSNHKDVRLTARDREEILRRWLPELLSVKWRKGRAQGRKPLPVGCFFRKSCSFSKLSPATL